MRDLRLHLLNGKIVDITLIEYAHCSSGSNYFGSPDHAIENAASKGFISTNERGEICGQDGGCGSVVYPWPSIEKVEIVERKQGS
jgi:hypothetical protein